MFLRRLRNFAARWTYLTLCFLQANFYGDNYIEIMCQNIFFYSCFHLYGYLPYIYPPSFSPFLSLPFLIAFPPPPPPPPPPIRMWPQPFSPMLYRICTRVQRNCENLCRYSRPFNSLPPVYQSLKNDLPLSVSMCRPRTGGNLFKYWPSEKLLDLGDRLAPDTYHIPNTVGHVRTI